jgi:hypothetical protein
MRLYFVLTLVYGLEGAAASETLIGSGRFTSLDPEGCTIGWSKSPATSSTDSVIYHPGASA